MAECAHCCTPTGSEARFCCKGCEFGYDLIHDEGLDRYYTLRQDSPVKPVRSVPFEAHDFTWLIEKAREIESAPGKTVEGDFSLDGISWIGCVWLVEKIFLRQPGALEAAAHPATGRVHLGWQSGRTDLAAFAQELVSFAHTLAPRRSGSSASEGGQLGARLGLCGAFMLNAMGFTLPSYLGMPPDFAYSGLFQLIGLLTATLSMLVGGSYFINRAWQAARMKTLHVDLPIALGLLVAFSGSLAGWLGAANRRADLFRLRLHLRFPDVRGPLFSAFDDGGKPSAAATPAPGPGDDALAGSFRAARTQRSSSEGAFPTRAGPSGAGGCGARQRGGGFLARMDQW